MSDPWHDFWVTQGGGYSNGINLRPSTYDYKKHASYVADKIDLKESDNLLDVGCGNGQMLDELIVYTKHLNGVDFAKNMVILSSELMKKRGISGTFCEVNAQNLEVFKDDSMDKIICMAVMQYFTDDDKAKEAVSEMLRVCKKDGKILIGDVFDARIIKKGKNGMWSYLPEELANGYDFEVFKSAYEPEKRFDLLIKK